jgi:hypothetical protein
MGRAAGSGQTSDAPQISLGVALGDAATLKCLLPACMYGLECYNGLQIGYGDSQDQMKVESSLYGS